MSHQNEREAEQAVQKDYIRRTDMSDSDGTTELQRQHTHCKLISDKSTLTKHEEQDTH